MGYQGDNHIKIDIITSVFVLCFSEHMEAERIVFGLAHIAGRGFFSRQDVWWRASPIIYLFCVLRGFLFIGRFQDKQIQESVPYPASGNASV